MGHSSEFDWSTEVNSAMLSVPPASAVLQTPPSKGAVIFKKPEITTSLPDQSVTIDIEIDKQSSTNTPTTSNPLSQILAQSSHPGTLIAHFLFRSAAIIFYLFSSLLSFWIPATDSFVFVFVMVAIFLAMDFWIVKNVTGRRLVGMRWWTRIDLEGKTVWYFEGHSKDQFNPNPMDSKMFWLALYAYPAMWILMGMVALFTFSFAWMVVDGLALVLCISNLVGYVKCDRHIRRQATPTAETSNIASSFASSIFVNLITSKLTSLIK